MELVDSRNKEGGYLRVEYSISEKKRKNPLGESDLELFSRWGNCLLCQVC